MFSKTEITVHLFNEIYLQDYIDKQAVDLYKLPKYTEEEWMNMEVELEAKRIAEQKKIGLVSIPDYTAIEQKSISRKPKNSYIEEVYLIFYLKHATQDLELFRIRPQSYIKKITEAVVKTNEIIFEIETGWPNENFSAGVVQKVKRRKAEILTDIEKKIAALNKEIEHVNAALYNKYVMMLTTEKEIALKKKSYSGKV